MTTTIISLVTVSLQAGGFGGLVQPGECGCIIGDLSPAGCLREDCTAGYKHTHSERPGDWIVSPKKDGITDAYIERCLSETVLFYQQNGINTGKLSEISPSGLSIRESRPMSEDQLQSDGCG